MTTTIRYILFCAQEANFQTRSMLIPYDQIMDCSERVKDLELLRSHAVHNVVYDHKGKNYVVDQLIIKNINWSGSLGNCEDTNVNQIISDLLTYANGDNYVYTHDKKYYLQSYDEKWADNVICNVASEGFNNITNYCNFRRRTKYKKKPIQIVEGFLILESNDGKISMPPVDTVDEMYDKYFF